MKKSILVSLAALSSLVSVTSHAASEIRCNYKIKDSTQTIVVDYQIPNSKAKRAIPFLWHTGDAKFGANDIQTFTAPTQQNIMKNWIYIKAYSDVADTTIDMDIKNGKITVESEGRIVVKNARLSCEFNQGGE